jgi:hypothetical protein
MRTDNLKLYVRLHEQLRAEKGSLQARLRQIDEALGGMPLPSLSPIQGASLRVGIGSSSPKQPTSEQGLKRRISAAGRARIAEATRKRWALFRKAQGRTAPPAKPNVLKSGKPRMSAAARGKIAEGARRRWAAAKGAGKSRL